MNQIQKLTQAIMKEKKERSYSIKCDRCGKYRSVKDCKIEYETSDLDGKCCIVGAVCEKCAHK